MTMQTVRSIFETVLVIGVPLLVWLVCFAAPKYIEERVKGLAQKADLKDIREITERIRSQFDRGNVVHQVQFEAEFKSYQEIYLAAHHAVVAHIKWRSVTFDTGQKQLGDFSDAQLAFVHLLEGCSPFIPEHILTAFRKLDELFINAKMNDALKDHKSIEAMKADRKAIDEAAQACAVQIRERLQSLVTLQ